ncbi:phenoloxidase-activating factor 3 [Leptinotarsa decemlineata]|uniref:phenoloxidase-activating factor 3 n=1 Tax=Leptinotarsa decemlineata TaxID=7539 RepID=UPI003D305F0A
MIGVRLGEYDLDKNEDCDPDAKYCAPPQDFLIDFWVIHPHYKKQFYLNDIALIKLDRPANFSCANVQPICLPVEDVDLNGRDVVVAGWGITEKGLRSSVLTKVSVPVVKLRSCQIIYSRYAPVTNTQICAGGKFGRDSCSGDSGGPLKATGSLNGTIKFIQYGIVSYGSKQCGAKGIPGIYTKVFSFMDWILDQLDT